MLPVHRLEDDLALGVTIKDESSRVAVVAHRVQDPSRDVAIEQTPGDRRAVHAALDRAVADDERYRWGQQVGNRPRERIAATSHQRHMDAGSDSGMDRVAILVRQPSLAVE